MTTPTTGTAPPPARRAPARWWALAPSGRAALEILVALDALTAAADAITHADPDGPATPQIETLAVRLRHWTGQVIATRSKIRAHTWMLLVAAIVVPVLVLPRPYELPLAVQLGWIVVASILLMTVLEWAGGIMAAGLIRARRGMTTRAAMPVTDYLAAAHATMHELDEHRDWFARRARRRWPTWPYLFAQPERWWDDMPHDLQLQLQAVAAANTDSTTSPAP
ncbi:hypothetical protein [Longispora urticae]